jgi:site-specific DNA recombinase
MTPSQSTRGTRQYRYYVCLGAQKRGWHTCPVPSVPAEPVEHLVLEQLQGLENAPANFGSLFEALVSAERCRLVRLVVERIDYHGSQDKLTIKLAPGGPLALAEQLSQRSATGPTD